MPPAQANRKRGDIADIGHTSNWPHIGAPPPADAPASRLGAWRAESASYSEAFESIKRSWNGFAASADDLRFKVQQYEDLIRAFTEPGGYGNLILADIARRLSDALLSQWAVVHVQESGRRAISARMRLPVPSRLGERAVKSSYCWTLTEVVLLQQSVPAVDSKTQYEALA